MKKKHDKKGDLNQGKYCKPTFSAAGHGTLEGAGDGLPGFLLSGSLFQRHRADQLTGGRWHLRSSKNDFRIQSQQKEHEEVVNAQNYLPKKGDHKSKNQNFLHSCLALVLLNTHTHQADTQFLNS